MLHCEIARGFGLDVEDSNDLVLDDERDSEFGADVGVRVDIVFSLGDVFNEEGLAVQRCLAYDAATEFDAHAFNLSAVADLEAHTEVFGAVVNQEYGEDFVIDDGADEVGDPMHKGVEVESGIKGVG